MKLYFSLHILKLFASQQRNYNVIYDPNSYYTERDSRFRNNHETNDLLLVDRSQQAPIALSTQTQVGIEPQFNSNATHNYHSCDITQCNAKTNYSADADGSLLSVVDSFGSSNITNLSTRNKEDYKSAQGSKNTNFFNENNGILMSYTIDHAEIIKRKHTSDIHNHASSSKKNHITLKKTKNMEAKKSENDQNNNGYEHTDESNRLFKASNAHIKSNPNCRVYKTVEFTEIINTKFGASCTSNNNNNQQDREIDFMHITEKIMMRQNDYISQIMTEEKSNSWKDPSENEKILHVDSSRNENFTTFSFSEQIDLDFEASNTINKKNFQQIREIEFLHKQYNPIDQISCENRVCSRQTDISTPHEMSVSAQQIFISVIIGNHKINTEYDKKNLFEQMNKYGTILIECVKNNYENNVKSNPKFINMVQMTMTGCQLGKYSCVDNFQSGLCEFCFKIFFFMDIFDVVIVINDENGINRIRLILKAQFYKVVKKQFNFLPNVFYMLNNTETTDAKINSMQCDIKMKINSDNNKLLRKCHYEEFALLCQKKFENTSDQPEGSDQSNGTFCINKRKNYEPVYKYQMNDLCLLVQDITRTYFFTNVSFMLIDKSNKWSNFKSNEIFNLRQLFTENFVFFNYDICYNKKLNIIIDDTFKFSWVKNKKGEFTKPRTCTHFILNTPGRTNYYNYLLNFYTFVIKIFDGDVNKSLVYFIPEINWTKQYRDDRKLLMKESIRKLHIYSHSNFIISIEKLIIGNVSEQTT
ncbi:hypothetical protein COBT_002770 [Conglomerata obtusa]